VVIDESHHLPAQSFERVLSAVKARYLVGLTATPKRRDGLERITAFQIGPVRHEVGAKEVAAGRPLDRKLIVRETGCTWPLLGETATVQEIYGAMAKDVRRNRRIFDDVVVSLREGRSPVVLTERKDHLELLASMLRPVVRHLVVLQGGMRPKAQRAAGEQLASIPAGEERVVLATGKFIGEGFDDARLDTLFLAMPISWRGSLVQYCGRLNRGHPGKREVQVYDYVAAMCRCCSGCSRSGCRRIGPSDMRGVRRRWDSPSPGRSGRLSMTKRS
jgi:superfamily II DNA or RNA helicase